MAGRRALALALALLLSGGCALNGRSLGGYVDDKLLKGAVKRRLGQEDVGLPGVTVDTFGGTVYLTGVVATDLQKSDAEIAVWKIGGVRQVVNDLVVRTAGVVPAVSPVRPSIHPLRERLPGVARVDAGRPGGPDLAYDREGRVIATIFTVSSRELVDRGIETLRAEGRPIDHVEIFPLVGHGELPAPHYAVVLWHVSEPEAAALR